MLDSTMGEAQLSKRANSCCEFSVGSGYNIAMKGIILSGGSGSRLYPITRAANKQLLPIYNKPMVYYPLTTLMLAGCREILVVVNPHDKESYRRLLGDGSQWGLAISYAVQPRPGGIAEVFLIGRDFIAKDRVGLILGDNLFYGDSLPSVAVRGATGRGAVIHAYWINDPTVYSVVEFADDGETPIGIVEKPKKPCSNWAVTGLYFYDPDVCDVAARLTRSARGQLEISDIHTSYLKQGRLTVEKFGRGYAWLDTGTPSNLLRAAQFVETVEERQGLQIGSPEEVAWRKGYVDDAALARLIEPIRESEYGKYLLRLMDRG
jgi:glucose-1-phosphate thymidylyltransferase